MVKAPIPMNELERLAELYRYQILETGPDEDFNDIVHLASMICRTPLSDITLIDAERQWFKARNRPGPSETDRDISFCAHTILQDDVFEVTDAAKDTRFADNPFVVERPPIRFYAGAPLTTPNGYNLGSLCVIDSKPGRLSDDQREALRILAKQVSKLLELHRRNRELQQHIQVEQELGQALEGVTEAQKTMISVMAHDVRAPMYSVKTVFSLFAEDALDAADVQQLVPRAAAQIDGTLELLDNIVDWGMLQIDRGAREPVTFLLHPLVERLQSLFESRLRGKNNRLVNLVPPDFTLHSDPDAIQFILRNLVDNAGKFTSAGTISISASGRNITVADTGVGMEEEVRVRLFEKGLRHSTKGTGSEKGSGLGLQLCRQFVERLGGRFLVESAVGVGTKVTLALP